MATRKKASPVVEVEVKGIGVQVDTSYVKTWEGVHHLKRLRDTSLSEQDRFFEMVDYYDRVVLNADEVVEQLGTDDVDAIYGLLGEAIKEEKQKN